MLVSNEVTAKDLAVEVCTTVPAFVFNQGKSRQEAACVFVPVRDPSQATPISLTTLEECETSTTDPWELARALL